MSDTVASSPPQPLAKAPSGIRGIDEITGGGLPCGRPTLVCGGAGCGKTLLAIEFLTRGALTYAEPGVFVAFEETRAELAQNVASLGFDLADLERRRLLTVEHIAIEPSQITEVGSYTLDGLFVRLALILDRIGARRIVLDTIEALFSGLRNEGIVRAELRRLFGWLKERGVTSIITAERGDRGLTRHGLEEYITDCVILLDHRVSEQIAMALVHEQLSTGDDLAQVDAGTYIKVLARSVMQGFTGDGIQLRYVIDAPLTLAMDVAVPLGLIVSELLTNSLKHAFPPGQGGRVWVRLNQERGELWLSVGDDGVGLPADLDIAAPTTLGLQIVHGLVRQLGGTLTAQHKRGTLVQITVPASRNARQ